MIFHDCVGSDGCNGCLDVNTPANAGEWAYINSAAYI